MYDVLKVLQRWLDDPRVVVSLVLAVFTAYLTPYFVFGEDSYVIIHDYLDSVFVNSKVLVNSGKLFAPSGDIVPQMNLPRASFLGEFSLINIMQFIFNSFGAHLANIVIIHVTALVGMWLLLKKHFGYLGLQVIAGASLCFALLPFWPGGGLSIAGQPLALHAFLSIRLNKKITLTNVLPIVFLPFVSSFVGSFFFLLTVVGFIWLYDLLWKKEINLSFISSIILMTLVFFLVEYRLILNTIDPSFVPHRVEFVEAGVTLKRAFKIGVYNFLHGQYHVHSLQSKVIRYSLLLIFAINIKSLFSFIKNNKNVLIVLTLSLGISLLYGFMHSSWYSSVRQDFFLLRAINLSRFHWLHPLLWGLIFALVMGNISHKLNKFGPWVVWGLIVAQTLFCFKMNNFSRTRQKSGITYRAFFAEELFLDIENYIGQDKNDYRVASVGIHPSIALYNGFRTADFYMPYYPLAYKHQFRKVIAKELDKNKRMANYFDHWGSRVYLFSSEMGPDFEGKKFTGNIYDLELDAKSLKELGVRYIFSRVRITNQFTFLKHFEGKGGVWGIYLYEVT